MYRFYLDTLVGYNLEMILLNIELLHLLVRDLYKILSEFLERERGLAMAGGSTEIPDTVVTSIIHLTQFLQTEGRPPALPDTQTRLREQLEAQERKKKERISQILRAQSSVEQFMMAEAAPLDPGLFMFSTLPVQ